MDKKYKKEIDKEVKDIHKTTVMVNNRMQKIFGLKDQNEDESDEENEELEDYLNDVNDEEVSSILLKAEQEMKEEEEEKKRQKKEKEENDEKMERDLKEELERISDDEKEKKKKKKKKEKKKKKKKEEKDEEEEEEDSSDDYEEFQRWKKMRKMKREKKKEENNKKKEIKENNKNREEKIKEEKKEINNKEKEKIQEKEKKREKEKKDKIIKNIDNNELNDKTETKNENNDKNDNKDEKDIEFDFNINNINNINNNDLNKGENNNLNNNDNNFNNNNINEDINNNNNNLQQNNKQGPIIPKNVYEQVSSTDKKVITDLLKTGNAKYQEGEIFSSMGKYSEALKCYYQAKNLFLGINKLVQTKKNVYPKEFRMIITSKINDKLKLVHQSAKNCSNAFKDKRIGQLINKNAMNNNINTTVNNNINNPMNNRLNINNTVNNNINNKLNNNINTTVNNNINSKLKNNNTMNNNINNKNSDEINNILSKNQNMNNNINNNNNNINNYNFDFNALNNDNNNNINNNNKNIKLGNTNKTQVNQNNQNKPKSLHDKEEDAMDQKILSEIMTKNPGVKFSDIIGMNDMKQTLYEIIVVPTIRPDLFTGIRTPQRGILLFGPPGTGKTMIAKAIASECGSTFFNISASSLTSKWVGESEKTVKSLFKIAYQKVPSIIFIDEIDSILSKRSESENEATKRLKTEFLIQFDGLGSNTNARLLVIAATNRPMDLDEALLRRLPKRVYCGPLDEDGRFEFIKKVINRVETDLSDEDIREIAKMTNDYSNSDLMELCREAAYKPVRELTNEEIMKLDKFRPINKKDLVDAAHKIRGTLSKKVKDELRKWNEQFGGV